MSESGIFAGLWIVLKYVVLFLIPFVEPQLAGILGALAYLVVRHELNMADMCIKSVIIVMFFGWLGAWAVVNIFELYQHIPDVWVKISTATVGFLSYDAMMALGKNSQSVIGWLTTLIKSIIEKVVSKWNS